MLYLAFLLAIIYNEAAFRCQGSEARASGGYGMVGPPPEDILRVAAFLFAGRKRVNVFWKGFDRLLNVMAGLAGAVLLFMTAAVCYTIFMRFFFSQTTIWIMQTTEYGLLWIVFLSTAWLLKERGHVITEILYSSFSDKAKRHMDIIMFMVGGITCAVCTYYGITYTYDCVVNHVTDVRAVTIPKAGIFAIIPVGFVLLTIQFFRMDVGKHHIRWTAIKAATGRSHRPTTWQPFSYYSTLTFP